MTMNERLEDVRMKRTIPFIQNPGRSGGPPSGIAAFVVASLLLVGPISAGWGAEYYLTVDVPAALGGVEFTPVEVVRSDNGAYVPVLDFDGQMDFQFTALHRRPDGIWLIALSTPVEAGDGSFLEPRDVIAWDGESPTAFLDGSLAGIPSYAGIDALLLDAGGALVLSFDVPVRLGATEYVRSDLVRHDGGSVFSLFWDAAAAGVPAYANLVGADRTGTDTLVMNFDVPVNLGGSEFLPGTLVQWDDPGFSVHFSDGGWPPQARLLGFSFVPAPFVADAPAGSVPDGDLVPGVPLTITPAAGSDVQLSWGSSCLGSDTDYEVYEGDLSAPNSHVARLCSTAGGTTVTLTPAHDNSYYLVVPRNAGREGSYGLTGSGAERPRGLPACEQQSIGTCP
jgi:hypothetical protein